MKKFISCDWGTSNLRLRFVDIETRSVLKEIETNEGIASIYQSWKNQAHSTDRHLFYLSVLKPYIDQRRNEDKQLVEDATILISGMASSTIGVIELDYASMPMRADGADLLIKKINPSNEFPYSTLVISGASTGIDVMRGEETLLAGCETEHGKSELFILPGTHSKHVTVKDQIANGIDTYMTGEFFALLSQKSILSTSMKQPETDENTGFFSKGIMDGSEMNLLNSVFRVRTNQVLKKTSPLENFHYLSGLLIGAELSAIKEKNIDVITVVAGNRLMKKYITGLGLLLPGRKVNEVDAGTALVNGHCKIISSLKHEHKST